MTEFDTNSSKAKNKIAKTLKNKIANCVVVCIGTEKVLADSLGPRVGSLLNENMTKPLFVYGLESANITAQNLSKAIEFIKKLHPKKKLVVVDAAVGDAWQIGKVQVSDGAIFPGAATNKNLQSVGDLSIIGIVANKDMQDFYSNSCERQLLVERMSQFIARCLLVATK